MYIWKFLDFLHLNHPYEELFALKSQHSNLFLYPLQLLFLNQVHSRILKIKSNKFNSFCWELLCNKNALVYLKKSFKIVDLI